MAFGISKDAPDHPAAPERGSTGRGSESIIAEGMTLDGDCRTDRALRVDGHVTGSVRASRLTIGRTGRVDGDVTGPSGPAADQAVVIEGRVGGTVRAHRVEVDRDGSIGSGLTAEEGVVRGHVRGPIQIRGRLVLEATSNVEGDVTAPRLGLKEGGRVSGTIRIGSPPDSSGAKDEPGPGKE